MIISWIYWDSFRHINIIVSKQGKPFQPIVEIYFHDGRSRIYYERFRFSWWQVEIFMTIDQDLHDHKSRFLQWQVNNFIIKSRDFYDDWSRFSWRQVQILFWTIEIFMKTGYHFCYRSWCYSKKRGRGVSLRLHLLVFGVNQKCLEVRWVQDSFVQPKLWKPPLRLYTSYNKDVFRTLLNIFNDP